MATDKPITGFDILPEGDVAQDDILVIVDVSDTSQSSAGSTKQTTLSAIFAAFTDLVLTTLTVTGLSTISKLKGSGSAPSATADLGSVAVTGTDTAGVLAMTNSSGATQSYATVTVTFASAFATTPYVVVTPGPGTTALSVISPMVSSVSATGFQFFCQTDPADFGNGGVFKFYYHVIA